MKIGEKVAIRPKTFGRGAMEGKVIWVHPKGRFAVIEFEIEPQGPKWLRKPGKIRLRESFLLARKDPRENSEKC